jgi:hypothetical protein
VADHLVPNQVLGFFEFQGERERGRFLFSKACGSLYRRRFKEFENAPFAAYSIELRTYSKSGLPRSFRRRFGCTEISPLLGNLINIFSSPLHIKSKQPVLQDPSPKTNE